MVSSPRNVIVLQGQTGSLRFLREYKVGRGVTASQFNVTQLLANLRVPHSVTLGSKHSIGQNYSF